MGCTFPDCHCNLQNNGRHICPAQRMTPLERHIVKTRELKYPESQAAIIHFD